MEEVSSASRLWELRTEWTELEAAGEPINPFLSWDWQWACWEAFGGGRELRTLVLRGEDGVAGIVPLMTGPREGALEFGGGSDLSDLLGFLFRPGEAGAVAGAALAHLFAGAGTAPLELDLHYLPDGSEALSALRGAASVLELDEEMSQEEVSPFVPLSDSFEAYLQGELGKKDRHELRRKLRRLDGERKGWRLVDHEELGLEPALDAFFQLLSSSGPHKVEFLTSEVEAFMRSAGRAMAGRGWLRLQFLDLGGELAAATLGFTVSQTWHLYNSGYRPELAPLSPGLLCVAEGIRAALAEGCRRADFLRGSEAYKYHLGARDRPLWHLTLRARHGGARP